MGAASLEELAESESECRLVASELSVEAGQRRVKYLQTRWPKCEDYGFRSSGELESRPRSLSLSRISLFRFIIGKSFFHDFANRRPMSLSRFFKMRIENLVSRPISIPAGRTRRFTIGYLIWRLCSLKKRKKLHVRMMDRIGCPVL